MSLNFGIITPLPLTHPSVIIRNVNFQPHTHKDTRTHKEHTKTKCCHHHYRYQDLAFIPSLSFVPPSPSPYRHRHHHHTHARPLSPPTTSTGTIITTTTFTFRRNAANDDDDDVDLSTVREEERMGPSAPEGYWNDPENILQELQVFFQVVNLKKERCTHALLSYLLVGWWGGGSVCCLKEKKKEARKLACTLALASKHHHHNLTSQYAHKQYT